MKTSHPHTPWRAYSAHAIFETETSLLWPKVANFGGLPELVPEMVASGSVEGAGVGSVRTLNFADGKSGKETLISFHPELFRFAYSMQDPAPFPWEQYFVTYQLHALGAGQTHLLITGFYHPTGGEPGAVKGILERVYRTIFEGLARALKVRVSIHPEE